VSLIERGQPGSPTANPRLLTGSESLDKAANLSFSDDGRFLILVLPTQAGRSSSVQVKVWDLERGPSIKALSDAQLRELACETAKHETGNAALMDHEMKWWEVSQPCGDP
jgi:hypothetical protein